MDLLRLYGRKVCKRRKDEVFGEDVEIEPVKEGVIEIICKVK